MTNRAMNRLRVLTLCAAVGFLMIASTGFAQPANDACVDHITLTPPQTVTGDTTGVTADDFPGGDFCGTTITDPGNGVWYQVVGTGNTLTASTCNQASYDTKISVFCEGCAMQTCVGGNDDGPGCAGFTSEISWCSRVGLNYLIYVHGFLGAVGAFDLTVTDDGVPCTSTDACVDVPVELQTFGIE